MRRETRNELLLGILLLVTVAVSVLCLVPGFSFTADGRVDSLLKETLPRVAAGAFVTAVFVMSPYCTHGKLWGRRRAYLWCLPCLFVALANFPFTALILGSARITRPALLPLFLLRCLAVGLLEEASFRGMLYPWLRGRLQGRGRIPLAVAISSAVFAVVHLFNLAFGADVGATFLQVGYSFLIGCMLAAVFERTSRITPCVLLHALFDVGGGIVPVLGYGAFQDIGFWVLTGVMGALCCAHVLFFLFRNKR